VTESEGRRDLKSALAGPAAAVLVLVVAATAAGNLQTTQCLLPSIPLENFGVQFTFICQGLPDGEIVTTRAVLEYTTQRGDDAADIMIRVEAPSQGNPVWLLSGNDLGWSGVGTFTALVETDLLNGVIESDNPDFSEFVITIEMADRQPLTGRFQHSTIEADILGKPCPWDLDFDDEVGITDFLSLLAQWGTDPGGPPDFNSNGTVDLSDYTELLENWGPCPS